MGGAAVIPPRRIDNAGLRSPKKISLEANPIDVHRRDDDCSGSMDRLTRRTTRTSCWIGTSNFPKALARAVIVTRR